MLVLDGHAAIGLAAASAGEVIFVAGGRTSIEVGSGGLGVLIAYPASRAVASLLQRLGGRPGNVTPVAPLVPGYANSAEVQA